MEAYINHIESQLKGEKDSPLLYEFKKQLLSDMTSRANELTHTGLRDQKVLSDLVISEHPNIKNEYKKYSYKKNESKRKTRAVINNILGSVIYTISAVIIFLAVSLITGAWGKTWLIIEGAMSLLLVGELSILIKKATKSTRKIFHPGARILLAINVMLVTQFIFLVCLVLLHLSKSWLLFIVGVIMIFVADAIYVASTKKRLAILNYLFYIIAASPMFYILLGALGIEPWSKGWLVIPMALLVDMIIVAIKILVNQTKKAEYVEVE